MFMKKMLLVLSLLSLVALTGALLAGPAFAAPKAKVDVCHYAAAEDIVTVEGDVTITLPDASLYRYKGAVGFTDPQVNPQTGTFAIRAVLPNPDRELLPGQYTRVRMPLEIRKNALLIPEECIVIEQGGVYVYVVLANNRVERRLIFVGPIVEGKMIVEKGLDVGESLILHGINKVYHGSLTDPISEADYEAELAQQERAQLQSKPPAADESAGDQAE